MAVAPSPSSTDWQTVDWRAHQRWITVADRPINVVELGDGPQTVVFVHGLSGSWQNWLPNLLPFAAAHRVVALDLPGFGASPMPRDPISIDGYARILDELLGRLGIEEAVLVGNSMGGFVSAELALLFPARVARLVLVGAAGISVQQEYTDRQLDGLRRAGTLFALYGGWLASRADHLVRRPRVRDALSRLVIADPRRVSAPLLAEQLRGSGKPGFIDAMLSMARSPIADRLSAVRCPTLVVHGDQDKLVPVRDADEFERRISDADKLIYAGVGHTPQIEVPERFNADVLAFVDAA